EALEEQERTGGRLQDILAQQDLVTPDQLAIFTSLQLGVPFVNLKTQPFESRALDLLSEELCRKYGVVPLQVTDGSVVMATEDPSNIQVLDELSAHLKKRIEPVLALRQDIQDALDRNYRVSGEIERQLTHLSAQSTGAALGQEQALSVEAIAQAPVVRALDLLIRQASRDRASDVHIEPQETHLRIRFRIDGILHDVMSIPVSVHQALISRLKIMAGLNIAERRRPQDGQIAFKDGDKEIDIRVATSNTVHGEMAVLRILDKTFALLALPDLGFLPQALEQYRMGLKMPFGMVLVSGPTGSGKTTTLYASINQLDNVGRKIITVEDPVEYRFSNITQMQVNEAAGVTFATGLRSIMRLDPDVILIGEIRDGETARVAIQAALTGHLVLSTVHANDTVGAVYRLLDLGIEPFLVASAVIGIMAQRMVRRVCPNCSRLSTVTAEEQMAYEEEVGESRTEFIQGAGCNFCAQTGYLGRTGIFEVMLITESIRRTLLSGGTADDMRLLATSEGMMTLWHDGMMKVKTGLTTPHEVIRNVFTLG
ncbi:MAG: GspE/PulE family protein, partial [Dehalococcoidia bacterium]